MKDPDPVARGALGGVISGRPALPKHEPRPSSHFRMRPPARRPHGIHDLSEVLCCFFPSSEEKARHQCLGRWAEQGGGRLPRSTFFGNSRSGEVIVPRMPIPFVGQRGHDARRQARGVRRGPPGTRVAEQRLRGAETRNTARADLRGRLSPTPARAGGKELARSIAAPALLDVPQAVLPGARGLMHDCCNDQPYKTYREDRCVQREFLHDRIVIGTVRGELYQDVLEEMS